MLASLQIQAENKIPSIACSNSKIQPALCINLHLRGKQYSSTGLKSVNTLRENTENLFVEGEQ